MQRLRSSKETMLLLWSGPVGGAKGPREGGAK